jgi:hypothetical protein
MKTFILFLAMLFSTAWSYAQSAEAQQLLLNVEKLAQLKKILTNMKTGYTIISKGYKNIKDISEGNFNLHDAFLNALLQVSPTVRKYKRVADIIQSQSRILKEYKSAFKRFKGSNLFNLNELKYLQSAIDRIYNSITDKLVFLRSFNNEGNVLAIQRGREMVDTKLSEKLNGL